jgi:hypothetical protein
LDRITSRVRTNDKTRQDIAADKWLAQQVRQGASDEGRDYDVDEISSDPHANPSLQFSTNASGAQNAQVQAHRWYTT